MTITGSPIKIRKQLACEMTLERAKEVLDLGADPSREEIITAHRRLMQKVHPDRGGSTYLAQQLNEAKRTLLKRAP